MKQNRNTSTGAANPQRLRPVPDRRFSVRRTTRGRHFRTNTHYPRNNGMQREIQTVPGDTDEASTRGVKPNPVRIGHGEDTAGCFCSIGSGFFFFLFPLFPRASGFMMHDRLRRGLWRRHGSATVVGAVSVETSGKRRRGLRVQTRARKNSKTQDRTA